MRFSFGGHYLVLFPKTREYSHSISIDLAKERLSDDDATTLINRFLSLLSWCDDQHAVLREGWSGNPIPLPVQRRDLAFVTSYEWFFNRSVPRDEELLHRLAFYREGLIAREAGLIAFSVLSFFKVFEVRKASRNGAPNPTKLWIAGAFDRARQGIGAEIMNRLADDRGDVSVEDYLWGNCRTAIAHASKNHKSDADASVEARRLGVAAEIIQALARFYIKEEFSFADS